MASLALLADMTAQAKAIEILISHAHDVSSDKYTVLFCRFWIDLFCV